MQKISLKIFLLLILLLQNIVYAQEQENPSCSSIKKDQFQVKCTKLKKGRIAFTYSINGQDDIYVLNFRTHTVSSIASDPKLNESNPSWSPDGQKLLYQASKIDLKKYEIILSDYKGENKTNLISNSFSNESPEWSPTGKKIVFVSKKNDSSSSIFVSKDDGSSIEEINIDKKNTNKLEQPKISPRNISILYTSNEFWPGKDIFLYSILKNERKILTTGYQDFFSPSWHPNGGSFLASHLNSGDIDIWEFQKGDKFPKILFERPGLDKNAIWNDDERRVFFNGESQPGNEDFQLFMWDNREDKIYQITASKGSIEKLSWTPFPTLDEISKDIR